MKADVPDLHDRPTISSGKIRQLVHHELSERRRWPWVGLLLAASAMTAVVAALLLTETGLPARTRWAFVALCAIGGTWIGFATWVLRARRPLYGRQELLATRLGVTFSGVFTLGALLVTLLARTDPSAGGGPGGFDPGTGGLAAVGFGLLMILVAAVLHGQARRRHRLLVGLRDQLEAELGVQASRAA